jgi:uncharacterized membrane protein
MGIWAHAWPAVLASFLASLVEFVEALTIVLAVGATRGWRSALIGAFAGAAILAVLVLAFGPALQRIPLHVLQIVIGVLLLLFGLRWLRKAILRAAGIIGLHDEEAIYAKQTKKLGQEGAIAPERLDGIAVATTLKAVLLEGLEVVFIVIATGAVGHLLVPAALGATAAGVLVIALGLAIHKPLTKVPENTLKYAVGLLLSSFGVFWLGEGLGIAWPGEDLSLVGLLAGFLVVSALGVRLAQRPADTGLTPTPQGGSH